MSVIVTDAGFGPDDWTDEIVPLADAAARGGSGAAVRLAPDDDPAALVGDFGTLAMVVVDFPAFSDGRGFTIARRLRALGYGGRLRARGHVLADQYAMARRIGFDEVEIDDALAARQPEAQWRFRADWRAHDHRSRLRG